MKNYKNLLLALGITTISGAPIAHAKENIDGELSERSSICRKAPSSFFLEIDKKDEGDNNWNVGCSVSNSGC